MAEWSAQAGVTSVAAVRAAGADVPMAACSTRACGRLSPAMSPRSIWDWSSGSGPTDGAEEKAALRAHVDAIAEFADHGAESRIDEALATIGVVAGDGP